jgi:hypothetical protein
VGCRLPHHRGHADCQEPRHSHAHPRGDSPTESIRPGGAAIGGHWRRRRVTQCFPRRFEESLRDQGGQSAGPIGDHLPAEPLAFRHTIIVPGLSLGDLLLGRVRACVGRRRSGPMPAIVSIPWWERCNSWIVHALIAQLRGVGFSPFPSTYMGSPDTIVAPMARGLHH